MLPQQHNRNRNRSGRQGWKPKTPAALRRSASPGRVYPSASTQTATTTSSQPNQRRRRRSESPYRESAPRQPSPPGEEDPLENNAIEGLQGKDIVTLSITGRSLPQSGLFPQWVSLHNPARLQFVDPDAPIKAVYHHPKNGGGAKFSPNNMHPAPWRYPSGGEVVVLYGQFGNPFIPDYEPQPGLTLSWKHMQESFNTSRTELTHYIKWQCTVRHTHWCRNAARSIMAMQELGIPPGPHQRLFITLYYMPELLAFEDALGKRGRPSNGVRIDPQGWSPKGEESYSISDMYIEDTWVHWIRGIRDRMRKEPQVPSITDVRDALMAGIRQIHFELIHSDWWYEQEESSKMTNPVDWKKTFFPSKLEELKPVPLGHYLLQCGVGYADIELVLIPYIVRRDQPRQKVPAPPSPPHPPLRSPSPPLYQGVWTEEHIEFYGIDLNEPWPPPPYPPKERDRYSPSLPPREPPMETYYCWQGKITSYHPGLE